MAGVTGSFRDPCGRVFDSEGGILRSVNACYRHHWEKAVACGLLPDLAAKGQALAFHEAAPLPGAWKTLAVERIPWVSYPYEWSFPQLRDAAVLTLEIQKEALARGMTLKDASAYNIQFRGAAPVFIDLLSFEEREADAPWQAYRQFCMHFLAPLALYAADTRLSRLSALWIDGIPLDLAWSLLPGSSAFSLGLQMHLHLHAKAENKYRDGRLAARDIRRAKVSAQGLFDIADSLLRLVKGMPGPKQAGEWEDYYTDTNYSPAARQAKETLTERAAAQARNRHMALDLGANTGHYSALLARHFSQVIAADIDARAVGRHYLSLRARGEKRVLPLVLDLANPSPGIGWGCAERASWLQRGKTDFVSALALTHHLYFSNGIPWPEQAAFFAALLAPGGTLLLEFVPREDSQVERLLAARDDIFPDYTLQGFRAAFSPLFEEQEAHSLPETKRTLLLLTRRDAPDKERGS